MRGWNGRVRSASGGTVPTAAREGEHGSESMSSRVVANGRVSGARRLLLVAAAALGLTAWAFANEDQLRLQQDPANWPINNGNYAG